MRNSLQPSSDESTLWHRMSAAAARLLRSSDRSYKNDTLNGWTLRKKKTKNVIKPTSSVTASCRVFTVPLIFLPGWEGGGEGCEKSHFQVGTKWAGSCLRLINHGNCEQVKTTRNNEKETLRSLWEMVVFFGFRFLNIGEGRRLRPKEFYDRKFLKYFPALQFLV